MLSHIRFFFFSFLYLILCAVFYSSFFYILVFYYTRNAPSSIFTPESQKLADHKHPVFSQSSLQCHVRRMWLVLFASCFSTCLGVSVGTGLSVHRPWFWALVLFWCLFEEWKWNLAQNAFHTSQRMLTNGYRCAFIWEYLDSVCFHDAVFIWRASQCFCSFTV